MKFLKKAAACTVLLLAAAINICPVAAQRGKYVSMDLRYDGSEHYYNAEEIVLKINGRTPDDLPMPPILLNNYTLVPAREVFEGLGAEVDWLSDSRQVQIFHENTTVMIKINSTTALVNGEEREMDIPAKIINDKTMIPLRFVSQAIDKEVSWDGDTRTAAVNDKIAAETTTEATTEATTVTTTKAKTETTTVTTTKKETTTETTTAAISQQDINKISIEQGLGVDMINISGGSYAPNVNVVKSNDSKLLTIDIENGTLTAEKKDLGEGVFIKNGYYYQLSQKIVRIAIELDNDVKYNVTKDKNITSVILSEYTGGDYGISTKDYSYVGNNFSFEDNKLIINNSNGRIDFNRVTVNDDYIGRDITLTIPADLTSVLTSTSFTVDNDDIQSVDINTSSYSTVITIHEKHVLAPKFETAGNYAVFNFVAPKEVYSKILVLDAGHGDHDNGATGNGLVEKELTLDILLKTLDLFEKDGEIKVYCTRTDDSFLTLWERQDMASELGDAFVSIHINSASSSSASGTETYCLYPNDQGNGITSYMLAEAIHENLIELLGTVDRGIKSNDYVVLKGSKPSTLIEVGFISNYSDAEMMASSANRQKVAQSIYSAVKGLFSEYPPVR